MLVLCYFYFIFFALSTERTWLDLHFTSDYTLYNLVCDECNSKHVIFVKLLIN